MPRMKKKGTTGQAKNFITRTQAVRKLQISLPDFRRLCIFKGIYPRQPGDRRKAAKNSTPNTTFYYSKDIQYLLHEPLLNKFREHNALAKKIARALGRGEEKDAARMERTLAPRMTLDHIVKERYPTFLDALKDLDDALSMLFLFANLPSHMNIPPKTIRLCQRLCHEFQHYCIITHSLRKSFLSIKGIYYQAVIQGQDILWLVPYNFVQRVTGDVDFRIMGTFVEFYTTLLGFVNYRLYTSAGYVYPPKFDAKSDEQGADLDAFAPQPRQLNGDSTADATTTSDKAKVDAEATARAQEIANQVSTAGPSEPDVGEDDEPTIEQAPSAKTDFKSQDPNADDIQLPSISSSELSRQASQLFKPFVFFLSRETPRAPLEFLIKAFGCTKIGWDEISGAGAFTHNELDERITHQVIDRPPVTATEDGDGDGRAIRGRVAGRIYVQPQWVWDSVNACELQRTDLYGPGATLPPHLSPFVKPKKGEYDPREPLEPASDDELDAEEASEDDAADEKSVFDGGDDAGKDKDAMNGIENVKDLADLNGGEDMEEEEDASGSEIEDVGLPSEKGTNGDDDFAAFSDEDAEEGSEEDEYERELKAEITGKTNGSPKKKNAKKESPEARKKRLQQEKEAAHKERQKGMMPRKKRYLYEKMEYGNSKKNSDVENLKAKRRKIEKARA